MARAARTRRAPTIVAWTSGVVAASLLVGGAVLAQGYDAEEVPAIESSVWVSRDASGGQFARVNTDIGEIESVNDAAGLADVVQARSDAFVFGSGYARYWPVDAADPLDIAEGEPVEPSPAGEGGATAGEGVASPDGTQGVVAAGEYVLFTGDQLAYALGSELTADEQRVTPLTPPVDGGYSSAVAALAADGRVATYSVQDTERRVRVYDIVTAAWEETELAEPPSSPAGLQLAFVGEHWVLYQASAERPRLWVDGAGPYALPGDLGADGLLQSSGPDADAVLVSSSTGLSRISLADGAELERVAAAGTAARPVAVGDRWAAAWLASGSGQLWVSGGAGIVDLEIDGGEFEDNVEIAPSLVSNGDRAVLLERTTGMLWSVPDGTLIPLRQWTADEVIPAPADTDVPDESPAPPISVDDAFGVRAGAVSMLPVLYNDHDANPDDVLSIDPESVQGLDPAFGTLSLVGANQTLVITVTGAVPTGSFSYRATDGKNPSATPATVTLSLRTGNTAPVWCDDYFSPDPCFVDWPAPQILIGGTATFDVLKGWVDAEGDAMVVDAAVPEAGAPIVAMPSDDGKLAIGHTDREGAPGTYSVMVTVRDAAGGVSEPRELVVGVLATPDFSVKGGAVTGRAGEWTTALATDFASGGSGAYQVIDVVELTVGGRLDVSWNEADGTIALRAAEPGEYIVTARIKDAATPNQHDVNVRYTVLPAELDRVAMPPLTAYVRQGEDTLVDVLGAVQNTTGKVLLVTSAAPGAAPDGGPTALAASVIDGSIVQLRGIDGVIADSLGRADGPLGSVALTLADADGEEYRGSISVFLVPASGQQPIAVPDAATVRAGDVASVAVLANDVAPRGERLALHPDVSTAQPDAGIAFSAGTTLRYVAPEVPGTYTVFYYAYLESAPELLARSQVTFTVLPPGANRAPRAVDLESRTLAGRSVAIPVPVDTMDPDGDRVQVTSVTQPAEDRLGAVMVGEGGRSLLFFAPEANRQVVGGLQAGGWQAEFTYTVKDSQGETATATARVAVSAQDPEDLAPVTFVDRVRVKQVEPGGEPVPIRVEPLLNDRDPADGSFTLGSQTASGLHLLYEVVPNMPGRTDGGIAPGSPYERARALQTAPRPATLEDGGTEVYPAGVVGFEVTDQTPPGTYYYLYTAESLKTRSTAEGVIAITVSPGDSPNQPVIEDTVVNAETRGQVEAGGIDVLAGKVVWPTGDASGLRIAGLAPGAPAGFSFDGSRIRGRAPAEGAIVPFRVEYGTDPATGEPESAWGLLRIPAFDDYRLQVVRLPDPITELETGDIELRDVLGVGADDTIEVNPSSAFATHRPSTNERLAVTACGPGSGSVVRYTAGYSPGIGSDTCTFEARLAGQGDDSWSTIVLPIPIKPKDPLAILTPVTKTVNIVNGRITVNLHDELVAWTGGFSMDDAGRRDTMAFSATYAGGAFRVTPTGPASDLELEIDVSPTAPSGARETVSIHLDYPWPSDPSLPHFQKDVALVLYVGAVPAQGPSGATLSTSCDAKSIESCRLPVVFPSDQSGQFNPLAGNTSGESTALRLVGVGGGSASFECPALGTASAAGDSIRMTLAAAEENKPPGGTCVVPFTVADVRGRTGTGQVTFDVTGFPPKPETPVTADSRRGEVDVDVVLGAALGAHPAVTGVRLYEAGAPVPNQGCARLDTGTFRCTVTGLQNGVRHFFAARTVNQQNDESALSGVLETWAFVAPRFASPPVYDDTVYDPALTTTTAGRIEVGAMCLQDNSANADQASTVEISLSTGRTLDPIPVGSDGCTAAQTFTVNATGPVVITATPVSGARPPRIGTVEGTYRGGGDTQTKVSHGRPASSPAVSVSWDGQDEVTASFAPDWNDGNLSPTLAGYPELRVFAFPAGATPPGCAATLDADGHSALAVSGWPVAGGAEQTGGTTGRFEVAGSGGDLAVNQEYRFKACGTYGYGVAESPASAATWLVRKPAAPSNIAPGGSLTYTPVANPETMDEHGGVTSVGDGPVFSWSVPDDPPTSNFVFRNASTLDAAPGTGWQLRFATSSAEAAFASTAHVSTDGESYVFPTNNETWFARYCFTDGQTFCSEPSGAIGPEPGSGVGIDFGQTATLSLPTQATCSASVDDWNGQIVAAGETAVQDARTERANQARQAGYNARWEELVGASTYYETWSSEYEPAPLGTSDPDDPNVPEGLRTAFRQGHGAHPDGFEDVYDPGQPNLAAARQAGRTAAEDYADAEAAAAGQAAFDAAWADFDEATDAPDAREDAERARLQAIVGGGVASVPALRPALGGFTTPPLASGPAMSIIDTSADPGRPEITGIRYDFTAGRASATTAPNDMSYVLALLRTELPSGGVYDCGF